MLDKIKAIAGAVVKTKLADTLADRLHVAAVPMPKTHNPLRYHVPGVPVLQAVQPIREDLCLTYLKHVIIRLQMR